MNAITKDTIRAHIKVHIKILTTQDEQMKPYLVDTMI
jgi:hypothetical protein